MPLTPERSAESGEDQQGITIFRNAPKQVRTAVSDVHVEIHRTAARSHDAVVVYELLCVAQVMLTQPHFQSKQSRSDREPQSLWHTRGTR
jgi:hypothetical protein